MKGIHEISYLHKSKCHGNQGHHQGSHSGDQELVFLWPLLWGSCILQPAIWWLSSTLQKAPMPRMPWRWQPRPAGSGGHVHKVLENAWHHALGGLVKVDGYIPQEETRDEAVNVQALGWQWCLEDFQSSVPGGIGLSVPLMMSQKQIFWHTPSVSQSLEKASVDNCSKRQSFCLASLKWCSSVVWYLSASQTQQQGCCKGFACGRSICVSTGFINNILFYLMRRADAFLAQDLLIVACLPCLSSF
jgi:hypothetical protein